LAGAKSPFKALLMKKERILMMEELGFVEIGR
jgi:hypothetical protein